MAIKLGGSSGEAGGELRSELLGDSGRGDLGGEDSDELLNRSSKSIVVVGGRRVNGRRQVSLLFGTVRPRLW